LKKSLNKIDKANVRLTKALKASNKATEIVKGISAFLVVVDEAIDLAKTLVV
jgi:hypothetical protein